MSKNKDVDYKTLLEYNQSEKAAAKFLDISMQTLYQRVDHHYGSREASTMLKYYCRGYSGGICFCWPMREEAWCPVNGYVEDCPLKNERPTN